MRTVAFIQAHMSSSRLPGKVLMDVAGKTVLEQVVRRLKKCKEVDAIVVITSTKPIDNLIAEECQKMSVPVFRGSDSDVLDRFTRAALAYRADTCVRITSDCPLIDPGVSGHIIRRFKLASPPVDYASNKIPQSFPRGLDTEVFTSGALERAWRQAVEPYQRSHVTIYIYEHPEEFKLLSVTNDVDRSHWRWTVDTLEDLQFVREVYAHLGAEGNFTWQEIISLLAKEPALADINRHILQRPIREG
jgi:spore coat polysaccharide biosynthesis protein SpsF